MEPRRAMAGTLYGFLLKKARTHQTVTYTVAGKRIGLDPRRIGQRQRLSVVLGDISHACALLNRPLLSSIVVREGDGSPGPGFFEMAYELDLADTNKADLAFWNDERRRVFRFPWK